MDNYLNYRWPRTDGVQPPPVPAPQTPRPPKKGRGRRLRRWAVSAVCVLLVLALLGSVSFWAANSLAALLDGSGRPGDGTDRTHEDDPRPRPSRTVSGSPDWSADDLPWGDPDPSVQLSVRSPGAARAGRDIYAQAMPSTVQVIAYQSKWAGSASLGTGVVVTDSGYVLTNYHIIDETVSIQVQLLEGDQRRYSAKVIGFDKEFDLAVLKFDPDGTVLTPAQLGDSDQLAVGDPVYALGNPMGYLVGSMSTGIVSALGRDEDASGSALGLIQVDISLNPGNSGGALLNESGQVVGITCAKITGLAREEDGPIEDSVVLEGMGLAIPITDAVPFVNRILATGGSWRPAMGIQCKVRTVDGRQGIWVDEITNDAARAAGLREGDLIVAANGVDVASLVELRRMIYRTGVDGELSCTVVRGGRERTVSFALIDSLED